MNYKLLLTSPPFAPHKKAIEYTDFHRTDIRLDELIDALIKAVNMNLLDIIIIIIMLFLTIRGLIRGVFMETASFVGVVLGFLLAYHFHSNMADQLKSHIPYFDSFTLQLIGFSVIFFAVLILCNTTGWLIKTIIRKTSLGWIDRSFGAGLAVLKGILITYFAIVILTFFVPSKAPLVANSRLAPLIISSYQSMIRVMSPAFYREWKERFMAETTRIGNAVSKKIDTITETDESR